MGAGATAGTPPAAGGGPMQAAPGGFVGVQPFLNNAINADNALASGGAASNLMQQVQGSMPGAVGIGGAGPSPFANMNPYLGQYFNAAALPMVQNYQNAVAPNILANAAGSGTVGGSGEAQAFKNAESGLAQGLGTLGANLYEPAWQQAQQIAAQQGLQTQALGAQAGMQAQNLGAQELMQGRQLGADLTQFGISQAPGLASAAYIPSQMMAASGANQQNQLQNILNTAYSNLFGQAQWPYQALGQLGQGLGAAQGNSGQQVTVGSGMGGFK